MVSSQTLFILHRAFLFQRPPANRTSLRRHEEVALSPEPNRISGRRLPESKRQKTLTWSTYEEAGYLPPTSPSRTTDESIRCICKSDYDNDSPWIECQKCNVWQHMSCMHLTWTVEEAERQEYWCEKCKPNNHAVLLDMVQKRAWKAAQVQKVEMPRTEEGQQKEREMPAEDARKAPQRPTSPPPPVRCQNVQKYAARVLEEHRSAENVEELDEMQEQVARGVGEKAVGWGFPQASWDTERVDAIGAEGQESSSGHSFSSPTLPGMRNFDAGSMQERTSQRQMEGDEVDVEFAAAGSQIATSKFADW